MPRRPRRAKARVGLTQAQREDLLLGIHLDWSPTAEPVFASPLLRRAAWLGYRDEIMAEWDAEEHPPFARPAGMMDYEIAPKHRRIPLTCTGRECMVRPTPNGSHEPHEIEEPDEAYLLRIGEATPIERGYFEAERRDRAEREDSFRRACEEYQATKRARSEPGAVVPILEGPVRVPSADAS